MGEHTRTHGMQRHIDALFRRSKLNTEVIDALHPVLMQRVKTKALPAIADYYATQLSKRVEAKLRDLVLSAISKLFGS